MRRLHFCFLIGFSILWWNLSSAQVANILSSVYDLNRSTANGLFSNLFSNPARAAGVNFYSGSNYVEAAFTVDQDYGTITYIIGVNGVDTLSSIYGDSVGETSFSSPQGIDVDANGNIYVADTGNNQVVRLQINYSTGVITHVANFTGISNPVDVVITGNSFWVVSASQNRVTEYSLEGSQQYWLGSSGSGNGQFSSPNGISARMSGGSISSSDIYVADTGNDRVVMFTKGGSSGSYAAWYSIPIPNSEPVDVASDPDGNAYVMDRAQGRLHIVGWYGKDYLAYASRGFNQPRNVNFAAGYYQLGTIEAWTTSSGVAKFNVGVDILNLNANVNGSSVVFSYILVANASMTGKVKNSSGQVVRDLITNLDLAAYSNHQHTWDGRDNGGQVVPDGQYSFELTASTSHGGHTSSVSFAYAPDDVTPPVISSVNSTSIGSSTATITWSTDEASDSQVEYGVTTSYGSSTTLNSSMVIGHSEALSGLSGSTLYYYRVKSRDGSGNLAVSEDYTFTTTGGPSLPFTDDFNSGSLNTAKWRLGTNAGNQSTVANNRLELRSSEGESGWVVTHDPFPARNTVVSVKVVQPNEDGHLGMAPTLTSEYGLSGSNTYLFYAWRSGHSGPYQLWLTSRKNSVETGFDITGSLVITGTFYMRLRFDNQNVYFEASFDGAAWTTAYSEAFGLPGYNLDTPFYYDLSAYSTPYKGVWIVDDFSITESSGDVTPPVISNVTAGSISSSGATITWTTNEASDSQVEYGLTTSYGSNTTLNTNMVTSHSQALSGLTATTLYHYRVKSRDGSGNLAVSGDFTFTTTSGADTTAPQISNVTATNISGTGATITWTTNEGSDSQVEYGLTTSYGSTTTLNSSMVTSHSEALSGLSPTTLYHYRVKSRDGSGNLAVSADYTFTTTTGGDVTPPVISNVTASSVTSSGATITWTTDESSDSQVEYGLTTSYGNSTNLNTSQVTSHSQALSGLSSNTLYHYRVKSKDASNNLAVSGDFTFTTALGTTGNIAPQASVSASSERTSTGQAAIKAIDGFLTTEWASNGEGVNAWIQLNFSSTFSIDRVVLYDRSSPSIHVTAGRLDFSNGTYFNTGFPEQRWLGQKRHFSAAGGHVDSLYGDWMLGHRRGSGRV